MDRIPLQAIDPLPAAARPTSPQRKGEALPDKADLAKAEQGPSRETSGLTRRVGVPAILAFAALLGACMPGFDRTVLPTHRLSKDALAEPVVIDRHATAIDGERIHLTREYLAIHNPPLAATLPEEKSVESISFAPRIVVVHYTAIPTLEGTLAAFAASTIGPDREVIRRNGLLNVGIHFVVDLDGTIYRLYPETVISRHVIGLNHVAIGIENVGDADLASTRRGSTPLTEAQLQANVQLIRYLAAKYDSLDYVIGHSEYTDLEDPQHPAHGLFYEALRDYRTEKSDPGRRFLRRLRRRLR